MKRKLVRTSGIDTNVVRDLAPTKIAKAIYQKRVRERLSLHAAASEAEVSAATLYRLETTTKRPDIVSAGKLATWLGMSLDELFR